MFLQEEFQRFEENFLTSKERRPKGLTVTTKHLNLHPQLKDLWSKDPYRSFLERHRRGNTYPVEGFEFVPLVSEDDRMFAELDIVLLSAARKGVVGDIDGRLKTILDAFRENRITEPSCPMISTSERNTARSSAFWRMIRWFNL